MKTKTIRQIIIFKASQHDIYEALMDSKKHSKFTNSKAKISREVGGSFTAYDSYITGKNLELVENKKIVQEWHASDWQAGHVSKVTFLLNKVKDGTQLGFTHENVPEEHYKPIEQGWHDFYWRPLKAFLEK